MIDNYMTRKISHCPVGVSIRQLKKGLFCWVPYSCYSLHAAHDEAALNHAYILLPPSSYSEPDLAFL